MSGLWMVDGRCHNWCQTPAILIAPSQVIILNPMCKTSSCAPEDNEFASIKAPAASEKTKMVGWVKFVTDKIEILWKE